MERRTPLASRAAGVDRGGLDRVAGVDVQHRRDGAGEHAMEAVGSKVVRLRRGGAAFARLRLPAEFVLALFDRAGDLVALHPAFELAPLFAVGARGGDAQMIALQGSLELQFVEGAGDLAALGLQFHPGRCELLAEAHQVKIPSAADIRGEARARAGTITASFWSSIQSWSFIRPWTKLVPLYQKTRRFSRSTVNLAVSATAITAMTPACTGSLTTRSAASGRCRPYSG